MDALKSKKAWSLIDVYIKQCTMVQIEGSPGTKGRVQKKNSGKFHKGEGVSEA